MSNAKNHRVKANPASRSSWSRFPLWACACVVASSFALQGCAPQGVYIGQRLNPPVSKVVIFDLEHDDGAEMTKMIGTQMTGMGKTVVYGGDLGVGGHVDLMAAATISRENQAGAFVVGQITTDDIVDYTKYSVCGTFTLHEVESGDQIGGILNAHYTEDTDPLFFIVNIATLPLDLVRAIFDSKAESLYTQLKRDKENATKAIAPQVQQKLADHVGREFSHKGLGVTKQYAGR